MIFKGLKDESNPLISTSCIKIWDSYPLANEPRLSDVPTGTSGAL